MKMLTQIILLLAVMTEVVALDAQSPAGNLSFPADWTGKWAGELEIYRGNGLFRRVPMQLHILPLDSAGLYSWEIIYGTDEEAGRRPYLLKPVDPGKGLYLIDEQNSIAMEQYFLGGKLFSRFDVMGSLLLATVEKRGEVLHYEIISGKLEPASITGDQEIEGEQMPPVRTFPIAVRQVAALKRMN